MTLRNRWLPVLGAGLLTLLGGCGGADNPPEYRETSYGAVLGSNDAATTGTYAWKGVPYAKPPVGALRWKAPVAPDAWTQTLQAKKFGNACLQTGRVFGPGANNTYDSSIVSTLNTTVGSEDCLTLNIWRPAGDERNLPVIVFVYGGSNVSGYTADPVYDGAALAKAANAVVVTTNYRLGVMGFLNLPQLKTGTDTANDSGNFALLDILQALKFVKANAAAFGGNAGNVTLMGQSAGAVNTWALLTSPLAAGLMHKVVPLSGGLSLASNLPPNTVPSLYPASTYLAQGNALLIKLLIADGKASDPASAQAYIASQTSAQIADYLRAKSGDAILTTLLRNGLSGSGPIPDGNVVPLNPIESIAAGKYNKLPVLAGNTAEEAKLFAAFLTLFGGPPGAKISDAERFTLMANFNPDAPTSLTSADILNAAYLPVTTPVTGFNARTGMLDMMLSWPNRDNMLNTLKTQQSNVWYYQFNWAQEPAPWNEVHGAAHGFDLLFLFGNFGPSVFSHSVASKANEPGRLALSAAMMASLGAFARNGDPNNTALGSTAWQPWPRRLMFDASLTQTRLSAP